MSISGDCRLHDSHTLRLRRCHVLLLPIISIDNYLSAILKILLTLDSNSCFVTCFFPFVGITILRIAEALAILNYLMERTGCRLMKKRFTFQKGKEKGRSLQRTLLQGTSLSLENAEKMTTVLGHTYSRTIE